MTAQLKIGTCPYTSARIKSWAAAAVVLQLCLKEFRMEIRNEALCCGKSWQKRSSDSSVFSGEDLMSSILHLLLSRKALKPFKVTSARYLHKTSSDLLQKCLLKCVNSTFTKTTYIYRPSPTTSLEQFLRVSKMFLLGYSLHIVPNKK